MSDETLKLVEAHFRRAQSELATMERELFKLQEQLPVLRSKVGDLKDIYDAIRKPAHA